MSDSRPAQDTPEALVQRLLATIRGQFCGGLEPKEWGQFSHFIRRNVILWPARFMFGKGFTLPAARYEHIMRDIFRTIMQRGQTGAVKYWPGYLMHCVQEHWQHHWEEYYAEAKSIRNQTTALLAACQPLPVADRTVEVLALTHKVLSQPQRHSPRPAPKQQTLFPL